MHDQVQQEVQERLDQVQWEERQEQRWQEQERSWWLEQRRAVWVGSGRRSSSAGGQRRWEAAGRRKVPALPLRGSPRGSGEGGGTAVRAPLERDHGGRWGARGKEKKPSTSDLETVREILIQECSERKRCR